MSECKSCHHQPSGRFDQNGWQCYCKCHDVADAAPDLLEALEELLTVIQSDKFMTVKVDAAYAAIAKAKGKS